ncbi:MAG: 30S ribosomal protein S8 [Candidatus Andersenbacteria bacterium]
MDTIANMLQTIINAQRVNKKRVAVPYSRFKESLARLLQEKGLLASLRVQEGARSQLILTLAYTEAGKARIHGLKRLSRPGQRLYVSAGDIPYSLDGLGVVVVSTSKGLMDDGRARKEGVGGELVCEIW